MMDAAESPFQNDTLGELEFLLGGGDRSLSSLLANRRRAAGLEAFGAPSLESSSRAPLAVLLLTLVLKDVRRAGHLASYLLSTLPLKALVLDALKRVFRTLIITAIAALGVGRFLLARNKKSDPVKQAKIKRVAIVGGGIAGFGAAYALKKHHGDGVEFVVFEKKPKLGGNAKSYTWTVNGEAGKPPQKVETGLAVLAYPHEFFHSYNELMTELRMGEPTLHELKYFVAEKNYRGPGPIPSDGVECVFAHGSQDFRPAPWLEADLKRWDSMAAFVRRVNAFFQPSDYKSLYRMNMANPLNVIPLRRLCRLWGISDFFWERVFVPVHTSTFLEVEMDSLPAVLGELLDDLVPLTKVPEMRAWSTHAYEPFLKMKALFPPGSTRTSCAVESVTFTPAAGGMLDCWVVHEDTPAGEKGERFDGVIFACSAPAMDRILHTSPGSAVGISSAAHWLEHFALANTTYTVDRDKTFEQGIVHSQADKVFPAKFREALLRDHCNYMEVDGNKPSSMENHFIISSWAPTANAPGIEGKHPMLVSYNAEVKTAEVEAEWTVTSKEAHPCLTIWQMAATIMLWPTLQGARNQQVFFCGSAVTPGNGHDLSFLSGIVAAHLLTGSAYPFPQSEKGVKDFARLVKMMTWGN